MNADVPVPGNGIRKKIMEVLKAEPGLNKSQLEQRVECSWGNLGHHLHALRIRGRIRYFRKGRQLLVFPSRIPKSQLRALATLRSPATPEILPKLRRDAHSIQSLADATGRSRNLISRYLRELEVEGIVDREPGLRGRYQISPSGRSRLERLQDWLRRSP